MRHKRIASENARLISLARNQLKMTQKQLSTKLSIDQAHLAAIEAGTAINNPAEIAKIKRFLGLNRR
jgi:ribosome-binding protein aMBF1 (putative translation factor)